MVVGLVHDKMKLVVIWFSKVEIMVKVVHGNRKMIYCRDFLESIELSLLHPCTVHLKIKAKLIYEKHRHNNIVTTAQFE